jgi:hypothetical protein
VGVGVDLNGELDAQDGVNGLDAGQGLFRDSTDLGSLLHCMKVGWMVMMAMVSGQL